MVQIVSKMKMNIVCQFQLTLTILNALLFTTFQIRSNSVQLISMSKLNVIKHQFQFQSLQSIMYIGNLEFRIT